MTKYAAMLISRHDAQSHKLSGKWRSDEDASPVLVLDDNGLGKLLIQWKDGNITEAAKEWFVKRFKQV
jgi:hypothetical protein